jgi:hypothetical protein
VCICWRERGGRSGNEGGVGGKESVEGEPSWVNGKESEDVNGVDRREYFRGQRTLKNW